MTSRNTGDAKLLDRGGNLVSTQFDVAKHDGMEAGALESLDGVNVDRALLDDFDLGNPNSSART